MVLSCCKAIYAWCLTVEATWCLTGVKIVDKSTLSYFLELGMSAAQKTFIMLMSTLPCEICDGNFFF